MTKQSSQTSLTALTHEYPGAVQELLKPETWANLNWWSDLNKTEQSRLMRVTMNLGADFMTWGEMKHRVGQHLAEAQEILTPHNRFNDYLREWQRKLNRSRRSLYRDIERWERGAALKSDLVAQAAAIKNVPIDKIIAARPMNPIPRKLDTMQDAFEYVDTALKFYKENPKVRDMVKNIMPEVEVDEDLLRKEVIVIFKNALAKLPSRKRTSWGKHALGQQLTIMGIASPTTIEPEAVPPEFIRGRGRPSTKKVIEGEAKEA